MKFRYFLVLAISSLALLAGCSNFYNDPPEYGDYGNQAIADPQAAGMSYDDPSQADPNNPPELNGGGGGDTTEVPFSATRKPGAMSNVGAFEE